MTTSPLTTPSIEAAPTQHASLWRRSLRRLDRIFVATVAIPTLVAGIYYGLIASDVYISESRFVVRSPHREGPTGLGALLAGAGISRSHDDTYTVHGYVLSRDALHRLEEKLKLREAFSSPKIDVFSRFPGLGWDRSFEAFFSHYTDHVVLTYDTASSITTLQVRGYTPDMARDVNETLLQISEHLVNNLNDRSRQDLIVVAQREVQSAENRSRDASLALSAFRSKGQVLDVGREAAMKIDTAARLREDLRVTETQIAKLKQVAPANPQLATLNAEAGRLRQAIESETAKALGQGNSLNAKSPVYERLLLDKEFADKALASAMISLEGARNDAARKQLYLERLVQPNLPDTALEPRRIRSVFTVLVVGLLAWGVVSLLVAGVREHVD
jgi:capsular polysaccharide transport system permease protein